MVQLKQSMFSVKNMLLCHQNEKALATPTLVIAGKYDKLIPPVSLFRAFLIFEEQLDHLVNKRNFHISDRDKLNLYLKNYNYQNFIKGYNDQFMNGFRRENNTYLDEYILNNEYIPEISKNEICRIMNYEKN